MVLAGRMLKKKGFTLVEVMIAVAVIAVMASIAIPAYLEYMTRAKMAEIPVMIKAIADGEITFFLKPRGEEGSVLNPCYLAAGSSPVDPPKSSKQAWEDDALGRFTTLGVATEQVYFSYLVTGNSGLDEGYCETVDEVTDPPQPSTDYAEIIVYGNLAGEDVYRILGNLFGLTTYAMAPPPGPENLPIETESYWSVTLSTNSDTRPAVNLQPVYKTLGP